MPRATIPPVLRAEGESISATTTDKYFQKPAWAQELQLIAVSESLLQFSPILKAAYKYVAIGTTYTDILPNIVDRLSTSTSAVNSLVAVTDFIYLFSDQKFNHLYLDLTNLNTTATSVVTGKYRKNDDTWAAISLTDGTVAGGIAFAQDGAISWTSPGDEGKISPFSLTGVGSTVPMYAIQISPSVADFDATVSIAACTLGPDHTLDLYLPAATVMSFNVERSGGIVVSHATSGNVRVNWLQYDGE